MQSRVRVTDRRERGRKEITDVLRDDLELLVHRIPASAARTPDFLVDGDPPGYIIEVKGRFDDKESRARLDRGQIVTGSESIGWAPWTADTLLKRRGTSLPSLIRNINESGFPVSRSDARLR